MFFMFSVIKRFNLKIIKIKEDIRPPLNPDLFRVPEDCVLGRTCLIINVEPF